VAQSLVVLRYPFDPNTIEEKSEPLILEDIRYIATSNQYACLVAIQKMVHDLKKHGYKSRFLRAMRGLPAVLELKNASRGGQPGGARVYLYRAAESEFHLCAAECKAADSPKQMLLERTAVIAFAWKHGIHIFKEV
jgi:hypothetical protein